IVALSISVATILLRRIVMWHAGVPWPRIYNGFDTRADALLIGCATALLVASGLTAGRQKWPAALTLIAVIGVLASLIFRVEQAYSCTLQWPVFDLLVATILFYLVTTSVSPLLSLLESRPLVWIGRLSYSLYLWHSPVFLCFARVQLRQRYLVPLE